MGGRSTKLKETSRRTKSGYRAPALEKGLDILETLAAETRPQTLASLARTLGRTSSEIFRMVSLLEDRGYIRRDETSGTYRLSLKLYELAHTHSPFEALIRASRRPMRELSDAVSETCQLAVLRNGWLVTVAQEESAERVRLSVEVGSKAPALHTVSGRLLVAHLSPAASDEILEADQEFQGLSPRKQAALRRELKTISQAGFTIAKSESRAGEDIAVIVGNRAIEVTASLAIPCLAGGPNDGRASGLLNAMRACAERIETSLGLNRKNELRKEGSG